MTSDRRAWLTAWQQERYAEIRANELDVLNAAGDLDPADNSEHARYLRQVARGIQDDYDPQMRDRIIWGGADVTESNAAEQNRGYSRDEVIARLEAEQARVAAELQARDAVIRAGELEIRNDVDALDPADVSKAAEYLRAVVRAIQNENDPAVRDRIIWGATTRRRPT